MGQHGVHRSGGHTGEQAGTAEPDYIIRRIPAGLRHNADPEAVSFQPAAEQGHSKGWMIHIGVARHQQHVHPIPTARVHVRPVDGQKIFAGQRRRRSERKAGELGAAFALPPFRVRAAAKVILVAKMTHDISSASYKPCLCDGQGEAGAPWA